MNGGTAEAEFSLSERRKFSWRRFGGKFLVVLSVAAHLLFGATATFWVVQRYQAARKLPFKGGPPSPNPSSRALEHKVQMAKKQSTMSMPRMEKRITTTGLSKVSLPEMPAVPKLAAPPTKMIAAGTDLSFSAGASVPVAAAVQVARRFRFSDLRNRAAAARSSARFTI